MTAESEAHFRELYARDITVIDELRKFIGVYRTVDVSGFETPPNSPYYCDLINEIAIWGTNHSMVILVDGVIINPII